MIQLVGNNPGQDFSGFDEFNTAEEGVLRDLAASANHVFTSYAAGTAYQLTNGAAQIAFGTTSPAITITKAGTYLMLARAKVDYNAATFVAARTATLKLRRTNNTAADVAGSTTTFTTQIITALSFTADSVVLPPVLYTTANADDVIQMHGLINAVPSAGSIDVSAAEIVAVRLY